MKIEMWSDFTCPFCHLGKVRLGKALKEAGIEDVELVYRSLLSQSEIQNYLDGVYEDDPTKKYHMPQAHLQAMKENIIGLANEDGIEYNFGGIKHRNMVDAHRLQFLAKDKGLEHEINDKLFEAHLMGGKDLGDIDVLIDIGVSGGLDREDIVKMYEGDSYIEDVIRDAELGIKYQVPGIPFFVIDNERSIRGAQPVSIMVRELTREKGDWL